MEAASEDGHIPPKPSQVEYAFYLILASTAFNLIYLAINTSLFWQDRTGRQSAYTICLGIFDLLIPLWLAFKINSGRNWARLVYLAILLIGLCNLVTLVQNITSFTLLSSIGILSLVLQLVAVILLFQKSSTAWFKSKVASEPMSIRSNWLATKVKGSGLLNELPTLTAGKRDWQRLNNRRRILWALRLILYLSLIVSIFLPWSHDDIAAWKIGLAFAYMSCGICLLPFFALILFGLWSIMRPDGRMIWAYRATLFVWTAYSGLMVAMFSGSIALLLAPILALIIEVTDMISMRNQPKMSATISAEEE